MRALLLIVMILVILSASACESIPQGIIITSTELQTVTQTVTNVRTITLQPTVTPTVTVTETGFLPSITEVIFHDVEAEPSVILELKKGDDVVLQVMETLLVEPTLTFYIAIWTPDLGQYYWYGYAEWNKEWPQYTFGFAATAAPTVGNYNSSRQKPHASVFVPPDGNNIEWNDKEVYLGLMGKLCEGMEEIGSYETVIQLLHSGVPGSIPESSSEVELQILDDIGNSDYENAISGLAARLPYKGTEVNNPGDVTYDELERVVQAIEASVIIMSTAADLTCLNPLAGVCFATGNKGGFAIGGFNAA